MYAQMGRSWGECHCMFLQPYLRLASAPFLDPLFSPMSTSASASHPLPSTLGVLMELWPSCMACKSILILHPFQQALNSRRGAAFGFAGIAKLAGSQLTPHVATLIPKLYRYQYDPNPRVQVGQKHECTASQILPSTTPGALQPMAQFRIQDQSQWQ